MSMLQWQVLRLWELVRGRRGGKGKSKIWCDFRDRHIMLVKKDAGESERDRETERQRQR